MALNGHGLPSAPLVTNLGRGQYRIEGVKFFMPGEGEVEFAITAGGKGDKVTLAVEI